MTLALHYTPLSDGLTPAIGGFTLGFTRASAATYVDADGIIQTAASGEARTAHYPASGDPGLLVEGARTNLCLYSADTSNAAWVASNVTKGSTSVTAPDGAASTTVRLTSTAGNGTLLQTITSASATRAYSVYMKRVTGTGNIDLTVDGGTTWTTKTLTAEWTRFDITQAAVTNPVFGVRIVTSGDAIDFWGSQCENGSNPSSYIPTTSATVTRAGEVPSSTTVAWYNDSQGTLYAKITPLAATADIAAAGMIAIGGTPLDNQLRTRSSGSIEYLYGGGVNTALIAAASAWTEDTTVIAAAAYAQDDAALSVSGILGTPDSTVDIAANGAATLRVGAGSTITQFNGVIVELAYFDERLDNTTLGGLSDGSITVASLGTSEIDDNAWKTYIPVSTVTGRTSRWIVSSDGFIPIVDET